MNWNLTPHYPGGYTEASAGLGGFARQPDAGCPLVRKLLENQRFACDADCEPHAKGIAVGVYLVTARRRTDLYTCCIFDDDVCAAKSGGG